MVIASIFIIAARRLWSTRWLALASAIGLVVAISLTVSVPMYSDAVYHRILEKELVAWGNARRPPFAFMYRYIGSGSDAVDWPAIQAADQMMDRQIPTLLGIPRQLLVRYFATAAYPIFASKDAAYTDQRQSIMRTSFGMLSDFANHITLVDGQYPADLKTNAPDEVMPVLVSKANADKLGLQVGERYLAYDESATQHDATKALSQIPVVISGVWAPRDPSELYWYSNPVELQGLLITSENNFSRRLTPLLKGEQYIAVWYMIFDGSGVRAGDVPGFLGRMNESITRADSGLSGIRLDHSPETPLKRYEETSSVLTIQLLAFSVPLLGLAYVFIMLVSGLTVNNQRNEIAVLRSRGASIFQIAGISFVEAGVLTALALGASAPIGERIAQLVGQTRSFLDFISPDAQSLLSTVATLDSMRIGLLTAGLALLITVAPTMGAASDTVVTYKQQRARDLRPPWWQRAGLDVLIFIPAAYGTYLLEKQGTLAVVAGQSVGTAGGGNDPFSNPLLFIVPMLALIALSLFVIRLLPLLLRLLTWLLSLLPGTSILLAIRQLARSPSFYAAPILLLTLTLSLAAFTASLAATLDQSMVDQVRYRIGADMSLTEAQDGGTGVSAAALAQDATLSEQDRAALEAASAQVQLVNMQLPVQDHLKVDGVAAAARVGRYPASVKLGSNNLRAEFIGVDRLDFTQVSFWRKDFAPVSLGALMNRLATSSNAVLVPDTMVAQYGLHIGDPLIARVSLKDGSAQLTLRVVGVFKLWPGWYPSDKGGSSLLVGNLDYLFEQAGYQGPYQVLLKTSDSASAAKIAQGLFGVGFNIIRYESTVAQIKTEQARPERQGLFGVLSVGFAATALLTVLGFFLYAVFSFRRRLIELGVLRAIGFGAAQTAAFLGWELALLLVTGAGAGTALGVAASQLYIPFMQLSTLSSSGVVPFQVIIAWPQIITIYVLFGALFIVALAVLFALLMRMKVFQAVKLGESL